MKELARYLAQHGRNGDTELLHVTKRELNALRGLGSLAGAKLTTNPHTGLPEAFNFKSLIPAAVGIGATVLSGGTLSPLMAGLISGATTTAATGDIRQGVMSGITGGAMAGLGQGLVGMGGGEAASLGGEAINSAQHFSDAGFAANQAAQSAMPHFSDAAMSAGMDSAASSMPQTMQMGAANAAYQAAPAAMPAGGPSMSTFMDNAQDPAQWSKNFGGEHLMSRTIPGGLALAGAMGEAMTPDYSKSSGNDEPDPFAMQEKRASRDMSAASDPYYSMNGGEHRYFSPTRYNFAAGGGVMSLPNGREADSGTTKVIRAIRSRYRSRNAALEDMKVPNSFMQRLGIQDPNDPVLDYAFGYVKKQGHREMKSGNLMMPAGFAEGGMVQTGERPARPAESQFRYMDEPTDLNNIIGRSEGMPYLSERGVRNEVVKVPKRKINRKMMAGGGAIDGPGDGMSDSIPTTIEGRAPAALARDEFVVPADVVSGLGNGSSKAGHEQLYDMIARVRAARTGTTQQAPATNPRKVMPK